MTPSRHGCFARGGQCHCLPPVRPEIRSGGSSRSSGSGRSERSSRRAWFVDLVRSAFSCVLGSGPPRAPAAGGQRIKPKAIGRPWACLSVSPLAPCCSSAALHIQSNHAEHRHLTRCLAVICLTPLFHLVRSLPTAGMAAIARYVSCPCPYPLLTISDHDRHV